MPEHVVATRKNLIALLALLALTLATTVLGRIDLDPWNLVIAIAIAGAKAFIVAAWFMHLRYTTGVSRLVVLGALVWLFILAAGTFDDYATRAWLTLPGK